jgi:DNA-binding winged helix-turn-helix (wHTH) protein
MRTRQRIATTPSHQGFEFDYSHNVVFFNGAGIHLSPHEADIFQILLDNRARTTPLGLLIQKVYGTAEPVTAPVSIRVAMHSLRKKLLATGIKIKAEPRVGYEIDAEAVPELNRGLSDKILIAINTAKASGEDAIAERLQTALDMTEKHRRKWLAPRRATHQDVIKPTEQAARPQDVIIPAPPP